MEQFPPAPWRRFQPWPGFHPLGFLVGMTIIVNAFVHDCTWRRWSDPELVYGFEEVPIAASPSDLVNYELGRPNLTYTVSTRTRIRRIRQVGDATEVMLLEGQHAGYSGWVSARWIK